MASIQILIGPMDLSHLTASRHKNTHSQQNNQKTQETAIIMVTSARHSPTSILKVSKIDNDLRNTAMQILYVQLTFPLFFLLLFYTARLSKLVD